MKNKLKSSLLARALVAASLMASGLCFFSSSAQATTINGTDVGALDTVLDAVDSKNSGLNTEMQLLEAAVCKSNCNLTLLENVESFSEVSDGTMHYIKVGTFDTPSYYVLKFGTGNGGNKNSPPSPPPNDMFFMLNNDNLHYLAWSDADLIDKGLPTNHVQSLSHYAITTNAVPEPATIALLGIAFFAAGAARKRNQ